MRYLLRVLNQKKIHHREHREKIRELSAFSSVFSVLSVVKSLIRPSRDLLLLLVAVSTLCAARAPEIRVKNRILTTVNGQTISVLDVMKQMDVFLNQNYPQYLDSKEMRMQYYTSQWRETLQRMVDEELMLADAESKEIKASDAEVREEIQNRYGPNVRKSLDRLGISYEEARKMVHKEIVVQKIQWLRVTSKVMSNVTNKVVKSEFDQYLTKNPPKELWTYQFLTLRAESVEEALAAAQEVEAMQSGSLASALDAFKEKHPDSLAVKLTLSSEIQMEEKELSDMNRHVLHKTALSTWSKPVIQKTRDGSEVVRIFHVKSHTKQESPLFQTMVAGLKNELLNRHLDKEMNVYIARLHKKFNFDQTSLDIPPQFEPFSF